MQRITVCLRNKICCRTSSSVLKTFSTQVFTNQFVMSCILEAESTTVNIAINSFVNLFVYI